MKKVIIPAATAFIFLASSIVAVACSCPTVGPYGFVEGKYKSSSNVFSGEVVRIDSGGGRKHVTFRIIEFWKGRPVPELVVYTYHTPAACGYDFKLGKKYLVFSNFAKKYLWSDECSGNRELERADAELKILSKMGRPKMPRVK